MKKIFVVLEGGIVQNVVSEEPLDVYVIDYDTEGASKDEITMMFGNKAVVYNLPSQDDVEEIQNIMDCLGEEDE